MAIAHHVTPPPPFPGPVHQSNHPQPTHLNLSVTSTMGASTIMMMNSGTASVKVQAANSSARTLARAVPSPPGGRWWCGW